MIANSIQAVDRAILERAWVGDLILLVICGGIIAVAALLVPSNEVVSFFGYDVPVVCGFRRMTGYGCPGCGMTRAFSFMAHGQVGQAFALNKLAPFVFAILASQVPWRLWLLFVAWRDGRAARVAEGPTSS